MAGIGKQLRGSGLAKSGFKSKYDVVSHERKRYADGSDESGVQNDEEKLYNKYYKSSSDEYTKEKNEDEEKPISKTITKYRRKIIEDPMATVTDFLLNPPGTGSKLSDSIRSVRKVDLKARKDVLGYKKGGKAKRKK
jgi:hypothetical protein